MGTFHTDVIQKDPRFQSAARVADPALIEPTTRRLVEQIIAGAQNMGIALMIYETYRSVEGRLEVPGRTRSRQRHDLGRRLGQSQNET
jgi:hypothetical protein